MDFIKNPNFDSNPKYRQAAQTWGNLLMSLKPFELCETSLGIIESYNKKHAVAPEVKEASKTLRKAPLALEQSLVKNDKIFRKNYNRDTWMVLGMSSIGLGLGVGLGAALGSMAFIGLGLPIGMAIGLLIGKNMDQKAEKEGRVYSRNS